jgi:hypothetical protein
MAAPAAAQDDPCCSDNEVIDCQDGLWCTGNEGCNCYGDCEPGIPRNCNDGDWCTDDYCINDVITPGTDFGTGHCEHVNVCINCNVDADCDDSNACTTEVCHSNICFYSDVVCNDSLNCTTDTCNPSIGCVFTDICVDPDICNDAYCDVGTNSCQLTPMVCDDGDVCTTDSCSVALGGCTTVPAPGVCSADWQCEIWINDGDSCTQEVCNLTHAPCPQCEYVDTPVLNDTCATATGATQSGAGSSMSWDAAADLTCNADDYLAPTDFPASPCGWGLGPDAVWTAYLPAEYQLYRYRLSGYDPLAWPVDFNPQTCLYYPYRQTALTPTTNVGVCGAGSNETYAIDDDRVLMCADIGGPACGLDATDACTDLYRWHSAASEQNYPVLPDGSYNILIDTGDGSTTGGDYNVRLQRLGPVSNFACDDGDANLGSADSIEPVEIQMGGQWTGNTVNYGSTVLLEGVGFCTQTEMRSNAADPDWDYNTCLTITTPGGCGCAATESLCYYKEYARAEYRINHQTAPWNRQMGYIISTENSTFNTALSLMGETCSKGCYCSLNRYYTDPLDGCSGASAQGCPLACDNDSGTIGGGASRLITGPIPSGVTASVSLHGYYPVGAGASAHGNYTLRVQYDSDGDGIPDVTDTSAARSGEIYDYATSELTNGPIRITSLPYYDSRTSGHYEKDLNANPSFCRRYTRSCDIYGCGGWGCANTTTVDDSSRDVFYTYRNTSGAAQNVRVCVRPLVDRETWTTAPPYRWDMWASVLVSRINIGAWSYYYNCEDTAEEERRCLFEGDSNQAVIAVANGQYLTLGVTGVNDSTGADGSRAGYYNMMACINGTAGCNCDSWSYRP